jgi:hypothetical protein
MNMRCTCTTMRYVMAPESPHLILSLREKRTRSAR